MNKIVSFLEANRADMLQDLKEIVRDLKDTMLDNPEEYTDYGCDEPSIDVRLCIDTDRNDCITWIIRTGSSDYDQYHSDFCAASCIGLDTDVKELLNDLINDIMDQSYQ
jgi:hypothetical protein